MKFIKMFSQEAKPSLKFNIHRRLSGWEEARSKTLIHASDLTKEHGFCPREIALLTITKKKQKGSFIGTSLRTTFDMGEALHDLLREKWGLHEAVGTWRCLRCGTLHKFCKKPSTCLHPYLNQECGNKVFSYKEETFHVDSIGGVGNMDMLVDLGESKLRVVEIKSIDKDQFKALEAPLAEHKWRTNLYMRMIEQSTHPNKTAINCTEGLVFYICKGFGVKDESLSKAGIKDGGFSPFKEFWVKRDDSTTQDIWMKAELLHQFRVGDGKMPKGICPTGLCKRAQECPAVQACFSGQYPGGV